MVAAFIIFLVGLALAIPFRIWQYFGAIDIATGFFRIEGIGMFGIYVLYAVIFVLLIVSVGRDKNTMDHPFRNGTKGAGVTFLVFGCALVYHSFLGISGFLSRLGMQSEEMPVKAKDWIFPSLTLAMTVVFIMIGLFLFFLKKRNSTLSVLLLFPVIWSVVRLWSVYMYDKPIITISEHTFELLSYFCVAWFLMSFAYCVSGFQTEYHQKQLVIAGFMGSILLFSNTIGKLAMIASYGREFGAITTNLAFVNLGMALVMAICPLYVCFGIDPLLDYKVLYESEISYDDPLAPFPSKMPVAPSSQIPSGLTAEIEATELDIWMGAAAVPADSMDESYRHVYDSEAGDEDLTHSRRQFARNPFHNNPNFASAGAGDGLESGESLESELFKTPKRLSERERPVLLSEESINSVPVEDVVLEAEMDVPEDE